MFERRPELMPLRKLLPWVGSAVNRRFQGLAAEHGMSPTALGVLGVLGHRDGLSHRELAGALGLAPATLTSVIDALENATELRRERDPQDRRVVRLHITAAGRERLRTTSEQVSARFRAAVPLPSPEDEKVIRAYLIQVLVALDGETTNGTLVG